MEVTFQEVSRHLGFETGMQWSEMAIQRTAPVLLGLFSLITLFAGAQKARLLTSVRKAAWYDKRLPTFADALALMRKELRAQATFRGSHSEVDIVKIPRVFMDRLTDALCYTA
jgi:hypothetical protein